MFLGIGGAMEQMLKVDQGHLVTQSRLMMISCLVLGTLIGEVLAIEEGFEAFGRWLKKVSRSEQDAGFVDAFVTTSLTICIGAMAIVGGITEGLTGDYQILATKAILDGIIVAMFTISKGKGALFSALPIVLLQGSVTLLARLLAPLMSDLALSYLSLVGAVMIFCVGLNLVFEKKIKVANMLPAICLAILWATILA